MRYVLECVQEGAYNYEFCESYALEEQRELGEYWESLAHQNRGPKSATFQRNAAPSPIS